MGNIKLMDPKTYGLIAAGEVVERPVSVVKELVENSIDAKATSIKIYLKNGGIDEIVVIDDGIGMDKEDVLASFLPHATSKIKNSYDLYRISTLGFRGEAISSISLVSKMTISSSLDGIKGYKVTYKDGNKIDEGITNINKGTKVEVEKLFINVPARLKYLSNAKKELSSIIFIINKLSIANPDVYFELHNDGKMIYQTSKTRTIKDLIARIYGLNEAKNIYNTEIQNDGYKLMIYLIKPEYYRSTKLEVTTIVNNRYIKNYAISNAFIEAFKTYLPISKYPIGIIYLNIDPLLIDVNIHPAKTEIKISIESDIAKIVYDNTKKLLEDIIHIPSRNIDLNPGYIKQNIFDENNDLAFNDNINIPYVSHAKDIKRDDNPFFDDEKSSYDYVKDNTDIKIEENNISTEKLPYMEYVGNLFSTYLIFENEEGMFLVDQHAAAERINYEYYKDKLSDTNQPITDLLTPIILSFKKDEAIFVANNLDKFKNVGFTLDEIDDNSFVLRSIPLWAKLDNINEIIYDILNLLIENKEIDIFKYRDEIAKQISCKASIKANHRISNDEIDVLMKRLAKCKNPYTCPHGRPTIIKFKKSELEKMFERIQSK